MHHAVEKSPEKNKGQETIEESVDENVFPTVEKETILISNTKVNEEGEKNHWYCIEEKAFVGR